MRHLSGPGAQLGGGSFGDIYEAVDGETGARVAVKLERLDSKHPQLQYEFRVLRWIQGSLDRSGRLPVGYPVALWHGSAAPHYTAMAQTLLGPSLENLFDFCGRRFSLKTTLQLGLQMLDRLQVRGGAGPAAWSSGAMLRGLCFLPCGSGSVRPVTLTCAPAGPALPAASRCLSLPLLRRVQGLHARLFIHRDIKPDNFLLGLGPTPGGWGTVYLIDFGLR